MFGMREAGVLGLSAVVAGGVAYLIWNYASSSGRKKPGPRDGAGPREDGGGGGGGKKEEKEVKKKEEKKKAEQTQVNVHCSLIIDYCYDAVLGVSTPTGLWYTGSHTLLLFLCVYFSVFFFCFFFFLICLGLDSFISSVWPWFHYSALCWWFVVCLKSVVNVQRFHVHTDFFFFFAHLHLCICFVSLLIISVCFW